MLSKDDFTNEVYALVRELNDDIKAKGKIYSDVWDGEYQYVDIVMEGGGVLGIALVGFTHVLEQVGIRFLRVGGASAGAINAMLLAALGEPNQAKSELIVEYLANKDLYQFVDGNSGVKSLIRNWMARAGKWRLSWDAARVWDDVKDDLGLNPGVAFYEWMVEVLEKQGITTTKALRERFSALPPNIRRRDGEPLSYDPDTALAIVAADISTQTKVVFPRMAPLYWEDPDGVNPAEFVRASMSIPFFFRPHRATAPPRDKAALTRWYDLANYKERPPAECLFMDGGIMSNFPIDLFHKPDRVPSAPTFGVKLGTDKRKTARITSPTELAAVIFDSARHCLDYDFIARNPDYRKLVTCIDTDRHYWLNFSMNDEDKVDLFRRGAEAADNFLRRFDWAEYKEIRKGVAAAHKAILHSREK